MKTLSRTLLALLLLSAVAQAEFRKVTMTVFGMD